MRLSELRVGAIIKTSTTFPATLDGETVNLGTSAETDSVSRAVNVIVPAKQVTWKLFEAGFPANVFWD